MCSGIIRWVWIHTLKQYRAGRLMSWQGSEKGVEGTGRVRLTIDEYKSQFFTTFSSDSESTTARQVNDLIYYMWPLKGYVYQESPPPPPQLFIAALLYSVRLGYTESIASTHTRHPPPNWNASEELMPLGHALMQSPSQPLSLIGVHGNSTGNIFW